MSVTYSGISIAALALRNALDKAGNIPATNIRIGHPAAAHAGLSATDGTYLVNLFFYRVEPGAFPAGATPDDPYFIRLFCLVTALAVDDTATADGTISAGEKELALIGEILAFFHAHPMLSIQIQGTDVAHLQIVPTPMTLEAVNNLWSTQKDTPYRLSVAYELALVPAQVTTSPQTSPLVIEVVVPEPVIGVKPTLLPQLAFLNQAGERTQVLNLPVANVAQTLSLTALGPDGSQLVLRWQRWVSSDVHPAFNPVTPTPLVTLNAGETWAVAQSVAVTLSEPGQLLITASEILLANGTRRTVDLNPVVVLLHTGGHS